METKCSLPSGPCTLAFIGFEYFSPKWKMCPTSMPRADSLSLSAIPLQAASSCISSVAA